VAGYSGTPLAKKLGIKAGHVVALINPPDGLRGALEPLPEDVTIKRDLRGKSPVDVILLFAKSESALDAKLDACVARLAQNGGLWICWPKKSSGVATDLSDGVVRRRGLATGLVDNKTCAVDDTWSGLRFVVRVANRKR